MIHGPYNVKLIIFSFVIKVGHKYLMKYKGKNYQVTFSIPAEAKPVVRVAIIFYILNYTQHNFPYASIEAKIHRRMSDRDQCSWYCTLARHGVA